MPYYWIVNHYLIWNFWHTKLCHNVLPYESLDIRISDICKGLSFYPLSKIVCSCQQQPSITYGLWKKVVLYLAPLWEKGHGLDIGLRGPSGWWMLGANLWHWSHCMLSHQYPWVRARCTKDLPPIRFPHIPSCNTSRSALTTSGYMHNR